MGKVSVLMDWVWIRVVITVGKYFFFILTQLSRSLSSFWLVNESPLTFNSRPSNLDHFY